MSKIKPKPTKVKSRPWWRGLAGLANPAQTNPGKDRSLPGKRRVEARKAAQRGERAEN